jgi:transglutaminase-like putative cysteine protease
MDLLVSHLTRYVFGETVTLGPHRLMLRPRDSFDLRILNATLGFNLPATLSWQHDVYGNSIAWAHFEGETQELVIDSQLLLRRYGSTAPRRAAHAWQDGAPIAYSELEQAVLAPFIAPVAPDEEGQLLAFAEQAVTSHAAARQHPLLGLSTAIHERLAYSLRFEQGTQAPLETLAGGQGSCRDFAWLFIEAARQLGYAARFVTGYLHNLGDGPEAASMTASVGYSHAWAEVFVPGDGWVEFDPTNALVADRHLIRVAVTRTPAEASPVGGSFIGSAPAPAPDVTVTISRADPGAHAFADEAA